MKEALKYRDNAFLGDLAAWERDHSRDNDDSVVRLRRNLNKVRSNELTDHQQETLHLYYDLGLSMRAIAETQGVTASAVSRTLKRARETLRRYLQYCF
jgi:RNA polymerase sigma factor (sigma-70 family)